MRRFFVLSLILISGVSVAEENQETAIVPEPPEMPVPVQSGETLEPDTTIISKGEENSEPDITIFRKGKKIIQEYRRNGELYMVKIIPKIGPAYYLIDTDGDGNIDVRGNDLDKGTKINQWKLFEWD